LVVPILFIGNPKQGKSTSGNGGVRVAIITIPIMKAKVVAVIIPAVKVEVAAPIVKAEEVAIATPAIKVEVVKNKRNEG